jgi:hypothetical protein
MAEKWARGEPGAPRVRRCVAGDQWERIVVFLRDERLELDNKRSEPSIKPFVIGRKHWLFSNTPRGARARATICSVIETAMENGLNPLAYLTWLFEEMPQLTRSQRSSGAGPVAPPAIVHDGGYLTPTTVTFWVARLDIWGHLPSVREV